VPGVKQEGGQHRENQSRHNTRRIPIVAMFVVCQIII
jgi:hypothetical protein